MKMIYHPAGKAGEYANYAVNLYTGCSHLCLYCYAPVALHRTREQFNNPEPRKGILEAIEKDADYMVKNKLDDSVFLCFSCDPYQPIDVKTGLTREVIKILHDHRIHVMILTKGGKKAERDFDLFGANDQFGVTLTCLEAKDSLKWEPGAALPSERLESLKLARYRFIKTWVSLEPVLDPETTLEIIRETHTYVDFYKVGKLNYHPLAQTIDWAKFGREVVALLESLGKKYYIKQSLQHYLEVKP